MNSDTIPWRPNYEEKNRQGKISPEMSITSSFEPIRATFKPCGRELVTTIWGGQVMTNIFKGEIISESLVASPSQVCQKEEKIGWRKRKENLLKIARLLEDQRASAGEDPVGCEHINFPSQMSGFDIRLRVDYQETAVISQFWSF